MALGDTKEGAGGAVGLAVSLFPVLKGPGADPDERGKPRLTEAQLLADRLGVG